MKIIIDRMFVIISIILGIGLGIVGELLYSNNVIEFNNRIFYIICYLSIFVLIMGVILLFKGLRNNSYANLKKLWY